MTAYLLERARLAIFLPTAALIALAARLGDPFDAAHFTSVTTLTLLLIAQFRLWDDLADVERDRLLHPQRVLSRSAHVDRFVVWCLLLATVNMGMSVWVGGAASVVLLILLDAATATWYLLRPRHRTAAGDLLILAKYPAFMVIAAGSLSRFHVPAGIGIYLAACVFEVWHDASSPLRPRVHA